MTNEEAARILDPATSREALRPYALDCVARMAVVEEACRLGAAALRERLRWIPVTERLPENEKDVLIAFTRKGLRGDIYRCVGMAFYTDGKTNTEGSSYSWEVGDIDMKYDEEADAYIIPEGWWETVNFGENFTAVDMPVTHWMPLPKAPEVE